MIELDYQIAVDLAGLYLMKALPIGIVFGMTERLANMFISAVTGDKKVKM